MADNNFSILLNANLNTKNVPQEIKELNAQLTKSTSNTVKIKVGIDKETGKAQFQDFIKTINTFKDKANNTFKQIKFTNIETGEVKTELKQVTSTVQNLTTETKKFVDTSGNFNTWTTSVNNLGETLQTRVRQYTSDLGELIKETSTWAGTSTDDLKQIGEVVKEVTNISPVETSKSINKVKTELGATVTVIKELNKEGQTFKTVITEENDAEKGLVKTTEKWNEDSKTLISRHQEIINDQTKMSASTKDADNSLKKLNNSTQQVAESQKNLGKTLGDAIDRLTKYYLASLPIQAFRKSISEAITTVKSFDAAITEMGKVTDYSGEKLQKYTKDLGELGKEVARTRTEMTEATTGWLKAGYSEEDAAKLAKYSALLQNTADEELSAAEATSILVSQLKAYHMEADEAIKVTDIINKVSAEQAVSSYDISQGLTVASAAMATFGNSIEKTTALLTAGTTVFQGRSSQVARG